MNVYQCILEIAKELVIPGKVRIDNISFKFKVP